MLKVGLIGSGGIARNRHIPAWNKLAGRASITAISDVVEEAAATAAQLVTGGETPPPVYTDYHTLINEAGIDAVDICLPHHLHADAILTATAAGKHILCEKPMCITIEEADRIVEAVDRAGIVYMSGHNELFYPAIAGAKELLDRGAVGKPFIIRSHEFPVNHPAPKIPGRPVGQTTLIGWRANKETMGGGVLIDKGYHPTYILLHMAGAEPVEVTAMTNTYVAQSAGEDTALVMVKFANGAIGQIFTGEGFVFPANDAKLHVIGERGEVYGNRYDLHERPRGFAEAATRSWPPPTQGNQQTFDDTIHHFYDSITTGQRPIQDHHDGRRVLEVILAAYRSIAEGRTITMGER